MDPPRYRGLCVIRAPYIPGMANEEEETGPLFNTRPGPIVHSGPPTGPERTDDSETRSTVGSISVGQHGREDSSGRRDTISSQISSPSTYYSVGPSEWGASSYNHSSYESGVYSPPTRTGSLASYPEDGSPGGGGWKLDDKTMMGADHATDILAASFDSTRGEEAVPEGMHPTCVKAPSTRVAKRASEASAHAGSEVEVEKAASKLESPSGPGASNPHDPTQRRPSEPATLDVGTSDSTRRSTSTPAIRRSISTPETPVSPHPADQVSGLRTSSGRGMSRTSSPAPPMLPNVPSPVMRTPDMGNLTIPEDDDSDVEIDLPTENDTGYGLPTPGLQENAQHPELEQKSCMLVNALRAETLIDLGHTHAGDGETRFLPPDLGGQVSLRNLMIQENKYATISDLIIYAPQGLQKDSNGNSPLLDVAKK